MSSFLYLNKYKLQFAMFWCIVVFSCMTSFIFLGLYLQGITLGLLKAIMILLAIGIGMPVMILCIAYIDWKLRTMKKSAVYFKLDRVLQTQKYYINRETRLFFTEEFRGLCISGYVFLCYPAGKYRVIFSPLPMLQIDDELLLDTISKLEGGFKVEDGQFRGIIRGFDLNCNQEDLKSDIASELREVTNVLKQNKVKPLDYSN